MTPEHYRKLAAAGLTVDQIGVVMDILAESEAAMKEAEEARKSVARERVQRWREKNKTDVTLQKRNGNATVRLTRAEDSSSKKDITGKIESKEDTSPAARSKRGERIPDNFEPDTEWAQAQGLSPSEASIEAAQFIDFWRSKPGKDGLKLDWPGTWRMWVRNTMKRIRHPSTAPPKKTTLATMWHEEARNHGILNDPPSTPNRHLDASLPRGQDQGTGLARRIASA